MLDEKANIFKVRYLYGKHGCICGRYKREGNASYPGRSAALLLELRIAERRSEGAAEVSRGHSRFCRNGRPEHEVRTEGSDFRD